MTKMSSKKSEERLSREGLFRQFSEILDERFPVLRENQFGWINEAVDFPDCIPGPIDDASFLLNADEERLSIRKEGLNASTQGSSKLAKVDDRLQEVISSLKSEGVSETRIEKKISTVINSEVREDTTIAEPEEAKANDLTQLMGKGKEPFDIDKG